jgi:diguanylate cyclase (GGDEF)-like protein
MDIIFKKLFYFLPTIRKKVLFLSFFLFLSSIHAAEYIKQLQAPFDIYEEQISSDPDTVLNHLIDQNLNSNVQNVYLAQYYLLLSQANYSLVYPEKALKHAIKGLSYINLSSQPWLYHKLQLAHSVALDISGMPSQGIKFANQALKWAEDNKFKNLILESLITRGYLYNSMVDYLSALDSLQKAYSLAPSQISNSISKGDVAGIIALVYEYRREHQLSIPYFQEAVNHQRSKQNKLELSIVLYGLGRANINIGNLDLGKNQLQESLDIAILINDLQGEAYALKELAGLSLAEKKFHITENMLLRALNIFSQSKNNYMLFDVNKVLCMLYLKTDQPKKVEYHLHQASLFINPENHPIQHISLLKLKTHVQASQGNYEDAYKDLSNIIRTEKKQLTKQSTEQLHRLRSKYELQSKEKENTLLAQSLELQNIKLSAQFEKNQSLKIILLSALIIIGLLLFMAYKYRKNKKHFELMANFDSLTGLYSRAKTLELLNNAFNQAQINNSKLYIAMIDLDHFKKINDQFGHTTGDLVLKQLGQIFIDVFKNNEICGRFGGEEFLVTISNVELNNVLNLFEKLRKKTTLLTKTIKVTPLSISLSIGICSYAKQNDFNDMIKCADDALYTAKAKGRNRISMA